MASFGQVGTVHPQDPVALEITKGVFPVLVNLNSLFPSELFSKKEIETAFIPFLSLGLFITLFSGFNLFSLF